MTALARWFDSPLLDLPALPFWFDDEWPDANASANYRLDLDAGAFDLAGQVVQGDVVRAVAQDFTLAIAAGAFALDGQDVRRDVAGAIAAGACVVAGQAVGGAVGMAVEVPVVTVRDEFTRANGPLGSAWETPSGRDSVDIAGNAAQRSAINTVCVARVAVAVQDFTDDHDAEITLSAGTNGTFNGWVGAAVRVTGTDEMYVFRGAPSASANVTCNIIRHQGASVANMAAVALPVRLGDRLKLRVVGNTLTAYWNGSEVLSVTDSAITSGQPGIATIQFLSGNHQLDDFLARDVPPVPLPTHVVSGQPVTFNVARATDVGAFVLAGQAVQGVVVQGAANFSLAVDAGAVAVAGQPVTFDASLGTGLGAFALTGHALRFDVARRTEAGTFSVAGHAVRFDVSLGTGVGAFAVAGQPVTAALAFPTGLGAFVLTGNAVSLDFVAATIDYTLNITVGALTLDGQGVRFGVARRTDVGTFVLNGHAVPAAWARRTDVGAFALDGRAVALQRGRRLAVDGSAYTITGQIVQQGVARRAGPAAFTLDGQDVGTLAARVFRVDAGALLLDGFDVELVGFLFGSDFIVVLVRVADVSPRVTLAHVAPSVVLVSRAPSVVLSAVMPTQTLARVAPSVVLAERSPTVVLVDLLPTSTLVEIT